MENGICTCKRYHSELEWQKEYAKAHQQVIHWENQQEEQWREDRKIKCEGLLRKKQWKVKHLIHTQYSKKWYLHELRIHLERQPYHLHQQILSVKIGLRMSTSHLEIHFVSLLFNQKMKPSIWQFWLKCKPKAPFKSGFRGCFNN